MIKFCLFAKTTEDIAEIKNFLRFYANKNTTIIKDKIYYDVNISRNTHHPAFRQHSDML